MIHTGRLSLALITLLTAANADTASKQISVPDNCSLRAAISTDYVDEFKNCYCEGDNLQESKVGPEELQKIYDHVYIVALYFKNYDMKDTLSKILSKSCFEGLSFKSESQLIDAGCLKYPLSSSEDPADNNKSDYLSQYNVNCKDLLSVDSNKRDGHNQKLQNKSPICRKICQNIWPTRNNMNLKVERKSTLLSLLERSCSGKPFNVRADSVFCYDEEQFYIFFSYKETSDGREQQQHFTYEEICNAAENLEEDFHKSVQCKNNAELKGKIEICFKYCNEYRKKSTNSDFKTVIFWIFIIMDVILVIAIGCAALEICKLCC
ncbi:MAG: hypothetical protein MHMPM18_003591 [Marteilia pararefringens]